MYQKHFVLPKTFLGRCFVVWNFFFTCVLHCYNCCVTWYITVTIWKSLNPKSVQLNKEKLPLTTGYIKKTPLIRLIVKVKCSRSFQTKVYQH